MKNPVHVLDGAEAFWSTLELSGIPEASNTCIFSVLQMIPEPAKFLKEEIEEIVFVYVVLSSTCISTKIMLCQLFR